MNEGRLYAPWSPDDAEGDVEERTSGAFVTYGSGIVAAKKILNDLHLNLAQNKYTEMFVDQVDGNTIAVTRHNPTNHKSVVLVARTCFTKQEPSVTGYIRNVSIAGKINEIIFEAKMQGSPDGHVQDKETINGMDNFWANVKQHIPIKQSSMVSVTTINGQNSIRFEKFTPSSVVAFDVSLDDDHLNALNQLKSIMSELEPGQAISQIVHKFDLDDLNYVLFRTDQEEKDERSNGGTCTYSVPGFATFNYCGLAGKQSSSSCSCHYAQWPFVHRDQR